MLNNTVFNEYLKKYMLASMPLKINDIILEVDDFLETSTALSIYSV